MKSSSTKPGRYNQDQKAYPANIAYIKLQCPGFRCRVGSDPTHCGIMSLNMLIQSEKLGLA